MQPSFRAAGAAALLGLALVGASASPSQAAQYEGRFEKTLKVSGPVELSVSSGSGSIDVQPAAGGSVRVVGTIHGNRWGRWGRGRSSEDIEARIRRIEAQPPVVQEGSRISVGRRDEDRDLYEGISISYEIFVPDTTSLTASTGSGSVQVGALRGPVSANSGSGSLQIGATGGTVRATTGSGAIIVDGAKEMVEAHSGSGSIRLRNIAGGATASAGSGSIEVEQTAAGPVKLTNSSGGIKAWGVRGALFARASSGSIRIQGTPSDTWDLNTSSGSIDLDLPSNASFTLRAHTGSGSINLDYPVTVQGRIDKHLIEGTVGSGGPTINARTSSGGIDINKSLSPR